jgi:hypothetical protein
MATRKSKSVTVLCAHLLILWLGFSMVTIFNPTHSVSFAAMATMITSHGLIDWYLIRVWNHFAPLSPTEYYTQYRFWAMIAVDQFLHLAILFALFA